MNSGDAFNEYKAYQGGRRKTNDILAESQQRLGLPSAQQRQTGLRTAISNTENLIRSVPDSVAGRTGGSMVTEAQRSRLVGQERAPLDDAFREQSRAYEGETANLNEIQRQAMQEAQLKNSEYDAEEGRLKGIYDTLYGREQDAIAKAERDRAFAEQTRQARAAQAQSDMLSRLMGGGGATNAANAGLPAGYDKYLRAQENAAKAQADSRAATASSWWTKPLASISNNNISKIATNALAYSPFISPVASAAKLGGLANNLRKKLF